jgi:hypothetical protein
MITYNISLKVEESVVDEWVEWMLTVHIPELMQTGCFTTYRLSRLLDQDEADGVTFSAQYDCLGMDQYNRYITEFAEEMRTKALAKFAGKFLAFRTVMETIGRG